MKYPKVCTMKSQNGKPVPNQFIIYTPEGNRVFQSYDSIIAVIDKNGKVTLNRHLWDYSTTTGKYRNMFLNETKRETEAKIKSGKYKLDNLCDSLF